MNPLKAQWQKASARFHALALRERALILVATIGGIALIFDTVAIRPLEVRIKRLVPQIAQTRQNIKLVESTLKSQDAVVDPGVVKRSYRDALRKQLAEIDQTLQGLQRGLVPPEKMSKLLEEMLARSSGLTLVTLRTLPVQRVETQNAASAAKPGNKSGKPAPGSADRTVYQHSVEITLQGSYSELLQYLAQLEKVSWQMFWGRIIMDTEKYPRLRVTLTVQTLSLDKAWLIV